MSDKNEPLIISRAMFDHYAEKYEQACNNGLALSGETTEYFVAKRIEYTASWLAAIGATTLHRIADFGCGVGHSTPHLRQHFPEANLIGLDVSAVSLRRAQEVYGDTARFVLLDEYIAAQDQQLVYCNGVFHHIAPAARHKWATRIHYMLAPGGHFALWENNPWNPGTLMVMRRIPFDRDAIPLAPPVARAMLINTGFEIIGTRYLFYFPKILSPLRVLERYADRIPFGAQYCVLARRPPNAMRED
jgi:SAM-dependent methyltransferase